MGTSKKSSDDQLYRQLVTLGDMLGDGDHGAWVGKEYKKVFYQTEEGKEIKRERRARKAKVVDEAMATYLPEKRSPCCSAPFQQTRAGSMVVKCTGTGCDKKYKFGKKKKK